MKKLLYSLFLLCVIIPKVWAQEKDSTLFGQLIDKGFHDGIDYVSSPFHWDKKDWLIAGGTTLATTASIFIFDKPVYNYVNAHQTVFVNDALSVFEYSDKIISPLVLGGFALHGVLKKDNYSLQTAFIVAESYLFNGVLVQAVKYVAGRKRPYQTSGDPLDWKPLDGGTSFYSGHTSTSFAVASVVAYRYKDVKWVPWVCYGLAGLTGLQRIYYNKHYTSDVLMGAVVGTSTGIFLAKAWEDSPIQFYPKVGAGVNGLSMTINF